MRNVTYLLHLTMDGCCDHTRFMIDEETGAYANGLMQEVDLVTYGRKFYEILFPYWAEEENLDTDLDFEFSERIVAIDKIVFSRSLENADYNTRIVSTDPAEELLKLKQMPGKNIFVATVSMLPELIRKGVIDEYHFIIYPIIVGEGRRLMDGANLPEKLQLKLLETKVFKSGAVALVYVKG